MISKIINLDLKEIVELHKSTYNEDHFSRFLSLKKLESFYLLLVQNNEYCYKYVLNGRIVSFIICGNKTNFAINQFIMNNKLYLFSLVLIKPQFLYSKAKGFINLLLPKKPINIIQLRLLSVCVSTDMQGKGIANSFFNDFHYELKKSNEKVYGLSVKKNNVRAINFYKKIGFTEELILDESIYYKFEL